LRGSTPHHAAEFRFHDALGITISNSQVSSLQKTTTPETPDSRISPKVIFSGCFIFRRLAPLKDTHLLDHAQMRLYARDMSNDNPPVHKQREN
jgi:hypothetical protein